MTSQRLEPWNADVLFTHFICSQNPFKTLSVIGCPQYDTVQIHSCPCSMARRSFKTRSFKISALWAFFFVPSLHSRSFVRVSSYRCRDKISWFLLSIFIQVQRLLLDVSPINIFAISSTTISPISSTTIFNISSTSIARLLLFFCSPMLRSNHLMDPSTDTFPCISWHLLISPFRHLI